MTNTENLLYMVKTDRAVLSRLLEDVSGEESMVRGADRLNHIRWIMGHLVCSCNLHLRIVGGAALDLPESYRRMFDAGSEVSDDEGAYPSMEQLRKELLEVHDRLIEAMGTVTDEELSCPVPEGMVFKSTRLEAATLLAMHTFYHAGQMAVMRRILGKERAFR